MIFNIVAVWFCLAHSSYRNFLSTMHRRDPVGVIRQPFSSGSGGEDGVEFICCVGGWEPQIYELWNFSEDEITCEFHPFRRIDVGDLSGDCFQTYYFAEEGLRVSIYGQISINRSVKWLGVPVPFSDTGLAWTDNPYFRFIVLICIMGKEICRFSEIIDRNYQFQHSRNMFYHLHLLMHHLQVIQH